MLSTAILVRTRAYIVENFLYMRPNFEIADEDLLLGRGIVDSMGMAELVSFLEDEFGIEIDEAEITEDNLGTLGRIAQYVSGKAIATEAA